MQPIEIMYVKTRAALATDRTALSATSEPLGDLASVLLPLRINQTHEVDERQQVRQRNAHVHGVQRLPVLDFGDPVREREAAVSAEFGVSL